MFKYLYYSYSQLSLNKIFLNLYKYYSYQLIFSTTTNTNNINNKQYKAKSSYFLKLLTPDPYWVGYGTITAAHTESRQQGSNPWWLRCLDGKTENLAGRTRSIVLSPKGFCPQQSFFQHQSFERGVGLINRKQRPKSITMITRRMVSTVTEHKSNVLF